MEDEKLSLEGFTRAARDAIYWFIMGACAATMVAVLCLELLGCGRP